MEKPQKHQKKNVYKQAELKAAGRWTRILNQFQWMMGATTVQKMNKATHLCLKLV